ncbi:hypothetical protein KIH27_15905 [Mycobacterium sp. M1]|uniref:Uncharacterized protein n=1 Tax=Mycolicibacter acidiphilus TaxID=2835306 RepID=A0ABS5RLA4_9MYCO|nr:hypothetical protein [Mycolicibacter acidiphilus]MBS9535072.1 hypothetical protein [Mycolicibacter acidiphilus]
MSDNDLIHEVDPNDLPPAPPAPMVVSPTAAPIKPFRVVRARTIAGATVAAIALIGIGAAGGVVWEKRAAPTEQPFAVPMGQRDIACVQVLRNGGVPEDCSRMYHLDFYP